MGAMHLLQPIYISPSHNYKVTGRWHHCYLNMWHTNCSALIDAAKCKCMHVHKSPRQKEQANACMHAQEFIGNNL